VFITRSDGESDATPRLVAWARGRSDVHALILTSSRARPNGRVDDLSDYDVIVAVTDLGTFAVDDAWLAELGQPLVRWGDESEDAGWRIPFRGVVYKDMMKVDYTIWPVEMLGQVAALDVLPDELDAGYQVLVDKNNATAAWREPTYRAFIPERPSAKRYRALVEEFWWDATYAAKALWRDELVFAKSYMVEHEMRLEVLSPMLDWYLAIDNDWSRPSGYKGREWKRRLPTDLWAELEATYVGPGIEETWEGLYRLAELFRRVAIAVGSALGYDYPSDVDDRVMAHVESIRRRTT
jgi:aminoglycoside 6-adenylyltransferase